MDRISAMRVFSEVVTRGSFTAAAETLGMSRAMVTRHIAELERWLGTRLLQRSTRRLSLTEAGEACVARSRQLLELVNDVEQVVGQRDSEPHGPIRITASVALGQTHLAPALVAYLARYPRTRVDLQLGDQTLNMVEERIDLAVRITNEIDPALIARKLSVCRAVVCAAPDYLARVGTPRTLDDLAAHNCLSYSRFTKSQWNLGRDGVETAVQVSGNLSANEASTLLQAVLAGGGVSMLPTFMVAPMLRSGALVTVLPEWQPAALGIYGVYVSRRHQPATLRTLLDFLAAQWGPQPAWDHGL
nr:LysR family transcriptional regulator [uncultured Albidiferax sp.]